MQFKGKLLNQTLENNKKPNFGPDFGQFGLNFSPPLIFLWVLALLEVRHCCKLSLYSISRNTDDPNSRQ